MSSLLLKPRFFAPSYYTSARARRLYFSTLPRSSFYWPPSSFCWLGRCVHLQSSLCFITFCLLGLLILYATALLAVYFTTIHSSIRTTATTLKIAQRRLCSTLRCSVSGNISRSTWTMHYPFVSVNKVTKHFFFHTPSSIRFFATCRLLQSHQKITSTWSTSRAMSIC
jgi:hypothetical protein